MASTNANVNQRLLSNSRLMSLYNVNRSTLLVFVTMFELMTASRPDCFIGSSGQLKFMNAISFVGSNYPISQLLATTDAMLALGWDAWIT